jgi:acetyltransferase-like isoleucine patch superfamily enzyme
MTLQYIWAKLVRKLRGKAILNSTIAPSSKVESGSHVVDSTMGRHSFCGYDCEITNCDIGAFCSIANEVVIGGGRHPMEWVGMSPVFYEGRDSVRAKFSMHKRLPLLRTTIGNDVWVGRRAIIKPGVRVGHGAVIGMGSIVTKDVKDYMIVAGCPAKSLRPRFDCEMIAELLRIRWWDFSEADLAESAQYFTDPKAFVAKMKKT